MSNSVHLRTEKEKALTDIARTVTKRKEGNQEITERGVGGAASDKNLEARDMKP